MIELDGSLMTAPAGEHVGIHLRFSDTIIKGLIINNFEDAGILMEFGPDNVVEGNWIGIRGDGETAPGNGYGIDMLNPFENTIGGPSPAARNVIAGPVVDGGAHVRMQSPVIGEPRSNVVQGNFIGTNAAGTAVVENGVDSRAVLIIGGVNNGVLSELLPNPAAPNVIGGHAVGIEIVGEASSGNIIAGNRIGTDLTATLNLGNAVGIKIDGNATTIGTGITSSGNDIAFNTGVGVLIVDGTGNQIRGNRIHDNAGLGIDLGDDGVTPNDAQDLDGSPNNLQNFPALIDDVNARAGIVNGTLNSAPLTEFIIEVFSNDSCDPSGHGQGQQFVSKIEGVVTDANGDAAFILNGLNRFALRDYLTATATDPGGNTSEFSACVSVPDQDITVNNVLDGGDINPGDGFCDTGGPLIDGERHCTLRAAIIEANFLPGADVIFVPEGTYILTVEGSGENGAATGDLDVIGDLTIIGAGRDKTIIDGNKAAASDPDGVFHVLVGSVLTMSDVTIQNGGGTGLISDRSRVDLERVVIANNTGSGVYSQSTNPSEHSNVTLTDSIIRNNSSHGVDINSSSCCSGHRGQANVTLLRSTVRNNGGRGVNISHSHGLAQAFITNSTIANNADSGVDNNSNNSGSSNAFISHSTIVGHPRALSTGSASDGGEGLILVKNSILAGNNNNCSGSEAGPHELLSGGGNISDDGTCAMFDEAGDVNDTDPLLGALADHGGISESFSMLPGSPAIGRGDCTDTSDEPVLDDQRGFARPATDCDTGSFQLGGGSEPGGPVVIGAGAGTITPTDGGTVDAGEGDVVTASISAPVGAVSAELDISVRSFDSSDPALPSLPDGSQGLGVLGRVFTFSPEGTQFAEPVTLTISYIQEHIDATELIEGSLRPLLLVGDTWTVVEDCISQGPPNPDPCMVDHDIDANFFTIETTHFSTYAFDALVLSDTLFVTSELDTVDAAPGDGLCADASGLCTLRAAIMEANANANVFNIDLPEGTYLLTIDGSGEDASAIGDLDVTSELTIDGAGTERTIIDGNDGVVNDHIINVRTGASLTLTDVWVTNGDRDGILNSGGTLILDKVVVSGHDEDGIDNTRSGGTAILTVENSAIRHNNLGIRVSSSSGFSGATIKRSTIRNNSTYGIYINNSNSTSQANVINSTISGNGSNAIRTVSNNGGTSRAFLSHSTVANNSSGFRTGSAGTSSFTIKNTILANNGSDNCRGGTSPPHTITSQGNNISSDAGCPMFTEPGDLQDTDPLLGPLQDNGGPTLSHAPQIGSPAVDAVSFPECSDTSGNLLEIDQRGHDRQTGAGCDIGAFEFNADFKLPNVPSMTQWGLIILMLAFGVVAALQIRRVRWAKS